MKKIMFLSVAAFLAALGAYKTFNDLARAVEDWDLDWEEAEEKE